MHYWQGLAKDVVNWGGWVRWGGVLREVGGVGVRAAAAAAQMTHASNLPRFTYRARG